jgi:spore germination protein GerM
MNEPVDDERVAAGGALRAWHLVVIALVALAGAAAYYVWFVSGRDRVDDGARRGGVTEVPEGSRTVTLFFAAADEPVLVPETRQVAIGKNLDEQAAQVMRALLDGPEQPGTSAIPEGTRLLGAFFDDDTFTLFLDLSSELVAGHPGGSAAEHATVEAIMRTVSENFPEVQAVQLLVDGSQVGTVAGHVDVYRALLVRDWR